MKPDFFDRFSKNTDVPNLIKIRPAGAELSHEHGQTTRRTDIQNLTVSSRSFAKRD